MLDKQMLKFAVALTLLGGLLILKGVQETYKGLRDTRPQTISYEEFVKQGATQGWFRITNCSYDLSEMATCSEKGDFDIGPGKIFKVFVPVRSADASDTSAPVDLVVERGDDETIKIANELRAVSRTSRGRTEQWLKDNADRLHFSGTIEGSVQFGADKFADFHERLKRDTHMPLSPDFVMLTNNDKPSLGAGILQIGGGALLLLIVGLMARRKPAATVSDDGNWQYPMD